MGNKENITRNITELKNINNMIKEVKKNTSDFEVN